MNDSAPTPPTCCERDCARKGHVCVSAVTELADTSGVLAATQADAELAPTAPAPAPAPKASIDTAIDAVASVAAPIARVLGGPIGGDLDIGIAALRALEAIVAVVKGTKADDHAVVSAAVVLHDVAAVLEAHDAAANAREQAKFGAKP